MVAKLFCWKLWRRADWNHSTVYRATANATMDSKDGVAVRAIHPRPKRRGFPRILVNVTGHANASISLCDISNVIDNLLIFSAYARLWYKKRIYIIKLMYKHYTVGSAWLNSLFHAITGSTAFLQCLLCSYKIKWGLCMRRYWPFLLRSNST